MQPKTSQLQIRVSPAEKAALKRLAAAAGQSVSQYVLSAALPSGQAEFQGLVEAIRGSVNRAKALSDIALYLRALPVEEFAETVDGVDLDGLPELIQNLVAASVEQAAAAHGATPPAWVANVEPPDRPYFGSDLRSLRPHLMRVTPPAFKRRNVYLATWGDVRQ